MSMGYNLWIDTANIPFNEESWKKSAMSALRTKDFCKIALFFRSESSMIKKPIADELDTIKKLKHIKAIVTIDIWKERNLNAESYYTQVLNGDDDLAYEVCEKICSVVHTDNSALRLASDLQNDIDELVMAVEEELKKYGIYPNAAAGIEVKVDVPKEGILYYNNARGKSNGLGGIIVLAGSAISKDEAKSCPDAASKSRKEALLAGELVDRGSYYELLKDKEFKSLSRAAGFVSGYGVNGQNAWKDKEHKVETGGARNIKGNSTSISSKINQILKVVDKVQNMPLPITDYSKAVNQAASATAEELEIGKSSVIDKCQRQLGLSAMEFCKMLMNYMCNDDRALYDLIMKCAQNQAEIDAVNAVFQKIIK